MRTKLRIDNMLRRLDRLVGAELPPEIRAQAHELAQQGWSVSRLERRMRAWIGEKLGVWAHINANRETGAEIFVVSAPHQWHDESSGAYTTVCATHGSTCGHENLTRAREWASTPWGWCDECRAVVEAAKAANDG